MLRKIEEEFETRDRDSEEYKMATIFKTIKFQIMFDFISRRSVSLIDTCIMRVLVFEVYLSRLCTISQPPSGTWLPLVALIFRRATEKRSAPRAREEKGRRARIR